MSEDNGTEITPEQQAYEAREVQQLLKHPVVQRAFAETEALIQKEWMQAENPLAREMCWHELHAFRRWKSRVVVLSDRRPTLTVER